MCPTNVRKLKLLQKDSVCPTNVRLKLLQKGSVCPTNVRLKLLQKGSVSHKRKVKIITKGQCASHKR